MVAKTKKIKAFDLTPEIIGNNDNVISSVMQIEAMAAPLWGGHFVKGANDIVQKLTSSLFYDKRFYSVTIESLKAQTKMHIKRQIVPEAHGKSLIELLDKLKKEITDGKFIFDENAKNIYEVIYNYVKTTNPKLAEWLTVARSETYQVSGDLRLWIRDAVDTLDTALQNLQAALVDKAEENVKTIFPGNSHNQLTQPISFGQHLMAYVNAFGRDRMRIGDSRRRLNESPYASGEIAGNSFNASREMVARALGFDKACTNAIDAISSRDFVIEYESFCSICSLNLSRLAQEMIEWHGSQLNYIGFSNDFVNQSQVIPYRRDPEALEIIRGKTAKMFGNLFNVLTLLKGLPLEFSSDLKELAEPVFDSYDTLLSCINSMSAIITDLKVNRKKMKEAAIHSFSTAIDLVDWLIQDVELTPEKALDTSRKIIEYAIEKGKKLSLLEIDELQKIEPKITDEVYSVLIPSRAIIKRRSGNGSNPVQIRKAIRAARRNYL
jgi:argininosuccinate lyase